MQYQYNCHEKNDYFKKAKKKEELSKNITDKIALAEMAQRLSPINLARKYI